MELLSEFWRSGIERASGVSWRRFRLFWGQWFGGWLLTCVEGFETSKCFDVLPGARGCALASLRKSMKQESIASRGSNIVLEAVRSVLKCLKAWAKSPFSNSVFLPDLEEMRFGMDTIRGEKCFNWDSFFVAESIYSEMRVTAAAISSGVSNFGDWSRDCSRRKNRRRISVVTRL